MKRLQDALRLVGEAVRHATAAFREFVKVWASAERDAALLTTLVPWTPDGCPVCQVDPPVCDSCCKLFKRGQLVGYWPVGTVGEGDEVLPAEVLICGRCYIDAAKGLGGYE